MPLSIPTGEFDLVADIGGTHARFCLVYRDLLLSEPVVRAVADYPTLESALDSYLADLPRIRPRRAALAVATAVEGDQISLTNSGWQFSIEAVRQRYRLDQLLVLNDFAALAHSLPFLKPSDLRQVGPGQALPDTPRGVLGPGTGLGVAGLIPSSAGWISVPGEGGHCSFCPADAREAAILAIVQRTFAHVSFERLVSGIGMPNLHRAIAEIDGVPFEPLAPAQITARALDGDAHCLAVVHSFCAMLGSAAGNLALTLGAKGGIFIGGGIVPRLGRLFDATPFRQRFEAKGRFGTYLATIPTFIITAETPALIGAAHALRDG